MYKGIDGLSWPFFFFGICSLSVMRIAAVCVIEAQ
jgi:hypothetical protein